MTATAYPATDWVVKTCGEGGDRLAGDDRNMIAKAYTDLCQRQGWEVQPLNIVVDNPIPIARGLGSSAAAIVTGMALAQLFHTGALDRGDLFPSAAALEGHPDNVAPAVYGGLQEVAEKDGTFTARTLPLSNKIRVLLVVPDAIKSTAEMRGVVPDALPPEAHARNAECLRRVLYGLASGDGRALRYSEEDRRHQPYRLAVQPEASAIFDLLKKTPQIAGAYLSGAGTTVAGWLLNDADPTAEIRETLKAQSLTAVVKLVKPDPDGIQGENIHD